MAEGRESVEDDEENFKVGRREHFNYPIDSIVWDFLYQVFKASPSGTSLAKT